MIAKLMALSVRARWAVLFLFLVVAGLGVWQRTKLPIDAGSPPAFYSGFAGTVHQHEFPRGENFLALDEDEISRRLLP